MNREDDFLLCRYDDVLRLAGLVYVRHNLCVLYDILYAYYIMCCYAYSCVFYYRMCSLTCRSGGRDRNADHEMCSLTRECVLLLENVFSY